MTSSLRPRTDGFDAAPLPSEDPEGAPRCTLCGAVASQRDIDGDWWPPCGHAKSHGLHTLRSSVEVPAGDTMAVEAEAYRKGWEAGRAALIAGLVAEEARLKERLAASLSENSGPALTLRCNTCEWNAEDDAKLGQACAGCPVGFYTMLPSNSGEVTT